MATNSNTNPATQGNQTIAGTTGADTLTGGFGNDTITGGGGDDVLRGDGPVQGAWHFETFNFDFTSAAGQAFNIENGVRTGSGYVTDFNVGGLTNSVRGTTGDPNDFGVVYTSTLNTVAGGTYRLTTTSDDGSTIQIFDSAGNALNFANQTGGTRNYLNNDFHQGATTRFGDVTLDPNETYTVQIRYWENLGGNTLSATIRGPDTGGASQNLLTSPMIGLPPGPEYSVTGVPAGVEGNDSIDAGAGNDTVFGDGGNDTISGGTGNDSIEGGSGADVLNGNAGNDTVHGGAGDDLINGGGNDDLLTGGGGNDTLRGSGGNDTIYGDDIAPGDVATIIADSDFDTGAAGWSDPQTETDPGFGTILGRFSGADGTNATSQTFTLDTGRAFAVVEFDALLIDSWDGEEFIINLNGTPVSITHFYTNAGVASTQTVNIGGSTYTIDFTPQDQGAIGFNGSFNDLNLGVRIVIDNPPPTLDIGFGSTLNQGENDESFGIDNFSIIATDDATDTIATARDAQPGNDVLSGGGGADVLFGGGSNDTLNGDTGDDTLTGGQGFDTFIYTAGGGADTITDFNTGAGQDITDGDQTNNDFLDLSAFYTSVFEVRADLADDGILNQSVGDFSDNTSMAGGSITLTGVSGTDLTQDNVNVACFVAGTRILTADGLIAAEDLCAGQMVATLDRGMQPLRRLLTSRVDGTRALAPIVFARGTWGALRDFAVSPMHRMFISDWRAELLFGEAEVLVPAVHLVNGDTIYRRPAARVTYVHLVFDHHEVVLSEGVASESFHPNLGLASDHATRDELYQIFPHFDDAAPLPAARRILRGYESGLLTTL